MTEVGKLVARLQADLKSWSANIERASRDVRRFADHAERHLSRAARSVARFALHAGRDLARFTARWTKRAALALAAIGTAAVKVASDAQEARNLFVQSMKGMADEAKRWADELAASLKLYDVEVKKTLGTFNVMLDSMGLGTERAFEMSKALTQLTYDIASFYNLRPEDAFRKLQAGITGEIEPLKRLGILINETTVKTWALQKGLIAEGQELTEVQKVIARYGLILEQTRTAQGDFARTSGDLANVLRTLWAQVRKLGESVGKVLLPHVTAAAVALREWVMEHREQLTAYVQAALENVSTLVRYLRTDWKAGVKTALEIVAQLFRDFAERLAVLGRVAAENFAQAFANRVADYFAEQELWTAEKIFGPEKWQQGGFLKGLQWQLRGLFKGAGQELLGPVAAQVMQTQQRILAEGSTNLMREMGRVSERTGRRIQRVMDDVRTGLDQAGQDADKLKTGTEEAGAAAEKAGTDYRQFGDAAGKAMQETAEATEVVMSKPAPRTITGLLDLTDSWGRTGSAVDEVRIKTEQFGDAAGKAMEVVMSKAEAYRAMMGEMGRMTQGTYEAELRALNALVTQYKNAGVDLKTITQWWHEQARKLEVRALQMSDSIRKGLAAAKGQMKQDFKSMAQVGYETAHSIRDAFGDAIYDMLQNARSFKDAVSGMFEAIASDMMRLMSRKWATDIMAWALPETFAAERHRGGPAGAGATYRKVPSLTLAAAPRLHRGLAADEFPAVLQRGEEVIAKDQHVAAPNVVINNNSGVPMRKQQQAPRWDGRNWVVSVVADNIEHGGVLNTVIANSMRRG